MTKVTPLPADKEFRKEVQMVRKAWSKGEKTVVINGNTLNIKLKERKVTFTSGGESHTRVEKWLIASPVLAGKGPILNIELVSGGNMRAAAANKSS